jgi:GrpB-like predicted nucleotidyltransferase (UPF0157 family)
MLTKKQKEWINLLPSDDEVEILPFDKRSQEIFERAKEEIRASLGSEINVEQRGSTSLGIAGQNEIDIYIPLSPSIFYAKTLVPKLTKLYGGPKSVHETRIRFQFIEDGKKIDIFLIDKESTEWINGVKFENYLKIHKEALDEYEKLKYACDGLSMRKFYEKKVEFINDILTR